MQTAIPIIVVLIVFGFITPTSAQRFDVAQRPLPPEIMADAYLLQVEQAVRDGDLNRGKTVIQKIRSLQEQHELDLEIPFYFRYARAAGALGMSHVAFDSVVKYLAAAGREGQHYGEALALMNRAKAGSSRGDVSAQLSPDIVADAKIAGAEQAIRDGDVAHARTAIQDIRALQEEHEPDLPDAFHFRYARAANSVDLPAQALESVMKYLAVSGREGQHYVDALELMNRAQFGVSCRGWDTEEYFKNASLEEVTACLETGIDARANDDSGATPLHRAARYSENADVIAALLNAGVDLEARDNDERTPLHWAVAHDNAVAVKALIGAGVNPDVRDTDSQTPLLDAAKKAENPDVIESLLNAGADKEARDSDRRTPLHLAVRSNNVVAIEALIKSEVDLEASDEDGRTPLYHAVEDGNSDAIGRLVKAGADRARVKPKWTPLHWSVAYNENPAAIKAMLNAGAKLKAKDMHKNRPIHVAAMFNQNPDVVSILIKAGADVNAKNRRNWRPLHAAARYNENPGVAELLLQSGADVRSRTKYKRTPLHVAATFNKNPGVAKVLIEAGADIMASDKSNRTPLHEAVANSENPAVVELLLKAGADASARDDGGFTPLHRAAIFNDNPAVFRLLFDAGANPNAKDDNDRTPLHRAASSKNPAVVELLLEAGADANARNDWGDTPLHRAASSNENPAVVKLLLEAGADANARNNKGSTTLDLSIENNDNPEVARLLTNAGATRTMTVKKTDPEPEQGTDWGKVAVGVLGAAAIAQAGRDAPQDDVDQAIADWARIMAGENPSTGTQVPSDTPSQTQGGQSQTAPTGDPMQQALQNMEAVCGEKFRSGFTANDHARFYCLAAFGDSCALKRAPTEGARTRLRASLARNCGVLTGIGAAGKCSYCQ